MAPGDKIDAAQENKPHRKSKKRKRKENEGGEKTAVPEKKNRKAFTYMSAVRMKKQFVRNADIKTKKHHVPVVDRNTEALEPPPIVVAVVGAPKVGKTTLIRGLLRNFTNLKLSKISGPITVVANKRNRLTFIECGSSICSMIDVAKVADLVLLLIDASFGFEMEAFEFLSICKIHGMPRVMGVLTHIDKMPNNKALKKTKKVLKHRFWAEVYQGAKLFFLSKFVNGDYLKREVHNLARFISVIKLRPIVWRNTHAYLLADRLEDLTPAEEVKDNPKCNRTVCLYGYARGNSFLPHQDIHVPGCGDFKIGDISFLPDPCPLPEQVKKRVLNQKEHLIYSPFSGVGGIVYDKDAVYIELGGSHSHQNVEEVNKEKNSKVGELLNESKTLDEKLKDAKFSLFEDSQPMISEEFQRSLMQEDLHENSGSDENEDKESSEDSASDLEKETQETSIAESISRIRRKMVDFENNENEDVEMSPDESENDDENFDDVESDKNNGDVNLSEDSESESSDTGLNWKKNLKEKASEKFSAKTTSKLKNLVYGLDKEKPKEEKNEFVGNLFTIRSKVEDQSGINALDTSVKRRSILKQGLQFKRFWNDKKRKFSVRNCFVTGDHGAEDAEKLLKEDDEIYGDFEDLEETGDAEKYEDSENSNNENEEENGNEDNVISGETMKEMRRKNYEKKKKLMMRKVVDADGKDNDTFYDEMRNQVTAQSLINKEEFGELDSTQRVQFEGYRAGLYVRIEIEGIPAEFVTNFDPTFPVVIGGLAQAQNTLGYLNLRVQKHRWFRKILKSKDPVVISVGWRRYQTISTFYIEDHNMRNRFLKYTPQFMPSNATVFGPTVPQGTGFLFVENLSRETPHFRVTATGTVLDLNKSTSIVKKLKLVGYPLKIYKTTAFIKGMFNSSIEVSKFIGGNIRTVSGIRGIIKKALANPPGCFRASFEDKVSKSDIVFMRTWYPMAVPQFYMPIFNLLDGVGAKDHMSEGMKTTGQLRYERDILVPKKDDSVYKPIERKPVKFRPLAVPKSLQKKLPYKVKPKFVKNPKNKTAVIREPQEKKLAAMVHQIKGVHAEKRRETEAKKQLKTIAYKKQQEKVEKKKLERTKEMRKRIYKDLMRAPKPKAPNAD